MIKFLSHSVAKALQWEIAKGHLRAMAAIDGAVSTGEEERPYKYEITSDAIETFIKYFEDSGYHEGMD
jgi:hypothetical protein